jgi:hypothetical protein
VNMIPLEDDEDNKPRPVFCLVKHDKCGFGEEGSKQRYQIPAPVRTISTPQQSVIRIGG